MGDFLDKTIPDDYTHGPDHEWRDMWGIRSYIGTPEERNRKFLSNALDTLLHTLSLEYHSGAIILHGWLRIVYREMGRQNPCYAKQPTTYWCQKKGT